MKSFRGTATSAIWKHVYLLWVTTFAPILTSLAVAAFRIEHELIESGDIDEDDEEDYLEREPQLLPALCPTPERPGPRP